MTTSGRPSKKHRDSPVSRGKQKPKGKGPLASRTGESDYPDPCYASYLSSLPYPRLQKSLV